MNHNKTQEKILTILSKLEYHYTACPACGYRLLKASEGSTVIVICPKCNDKIEVTVQNEKVTTCRIAIGKGAGIKL